MINIPNAFLEYVGGKHPLWVMELEQDFGMAGRVSQSKMFAHWYPLNFTQSALKITGRVQVQSDYNALAQYIRGHQRHIASQGGFNQTTGLSLLTLQVPSEGIWVNGVIKSFQDRKSTRLNSS